MTIFSYFNRILPIQYQNTAQQFFSESAKQIKKTAKVVAPLFLLFVAFETTNMIEDLMGGDSVSTTPGKLLAYIGATTMCAMRNSNSYPSCWYTSLGIIPVSTIFDYTLDVLGINKISRICSPVLREDIREESRKETEEACAYIFLNQQPVIDAIVQALMQKFGKSPIAQQDDVCYERNPFQYIDMKTCPRF